MMQIQLNSVVYRNTNVRVPHSNGNLFLKVAKCRVITNGNLIVQIHVSPCVLFIFARGNCKCKMGVGGHLNQKTGLLKPFYKFFPPSALAKHDDTAF